MLGLVVTATVGSSAQRQCSMHDLFPPIGSSYDFQSAVIPADCITLHLEAASDSTTALGDLGSSALAIALIGNKQVTTIFLESNSIGEIGAAALAEALQVNGVIDVLSIQNNPIGDGGAAAIAKALAVNVNLKALILDENSIGVSGGVAIADALKVNHHLTQLYLQNNPISDEGGMALAAALSTNTGLKHLHLEANYIGSIGANALMEVLKANATTVATLTYLNNVLGDEGAATLAEAIKVGSELKQLILHQNAIDAAGAALLVDAVASNLNLVEFDLGENQIKPELLAAAASAIAENIDPVAWDAKRLRLHPCDGQTSSTLCHGVGTPTVVNDSTCVCTACTVPYTGMYCETSPCTGETSRSFCNGRGLPSVVGAECGCLSCNPPWYAGGNCEVLNPCGNHTGCEAIVGNFLVEHFLDIDPNVRDELGIASVMDLLLLRTRADDLRALTGLMEADVRDQFLAAIEAAPPLEILQGDPTMELEEWANTVRLPAPALKYLTEIVGIDEVSDIFHFSDEDLIALKTGAVNPKDFFTNDITTVMHDDPEKGDLMKPQESLKTADPDTVYLGFIDGSKQKGLKYIPARWLVLITDEVRLLKPVDDEHKELMKDDIKKNFPKQDWINRMRSAASSATDRTIGEVQKNLGNKRLTSKWIKNMQSTKKRVIKRENENEQQPPASQRSDL
jgi:Ran GTPase-activating protein (RanGAP) involved in mRNA processing and transport